MKKSFIILTITTIFAFQTSLYAPDLDAKKSQNPTVIRCLIPHENSRYRFETLENNILCIRDTTKKNPPRLLANVIATTLSSRLENSMIVKTKSGKKFLVDYKKGTILPVCEV